MSVSGEDQQQLIRRIGRALLGAAPPNWKQIRAEYRSAGRHVEVDVLVTAEDGQPFPIRPPMDVVDMLGELRAAMYQPGRGTWLSGVYLLDHPSKYSAEFEPDTEPRWRRVPPPIGFVDELRRFPRDDNYIPGWLRARAGLPPLQQQQAEPTGGHQPAPGQSAAPSQPSIPGQPAGQPAAPGQPAVPGQTAVPGQPADPGQSAVSEQAPVLGQTAYPGQPSATGYPGEPSAAGQPAAGQPPFGQRPAHGQAGLGDQPTPQ